MKVTVFTSNQPRHISLINMLATVADEVYAIQECTTVLPGIIKDRYDNSNSMQKYFMHVRNAEKKVFGDVIFTNNNVKTMSLRSGDLSKIPLKLFTAALDSDYYIVFGASYITGELISFLTQHNAINIHMGISPYYRGSACNFWALYDKKPELVGATIHLLNEKIDAGKILYHSIPKAQEVDPFDLGMIAVKVAQQSVCEKIKTGKIFDEEGIAQDKSKEIRYSRNSEFTDEVANEYMGNTMNPVEVHALLRKRDLSLLVKPYIA